MIFFLASSPITWQFMKQKMVAQSSCEAEYIAAANAACQAYIVDHSSTDSDARVSAKCANAEGIDNRSAIALIKNPVLHGQRKHIAVKYPQTMV